MGLQGQLSDVSSESIPILLVVTVANCVGYLRSLLFALLRPMGLSRFDSDEVDEGLSGAVGKGLSGLIVLAEQLNMNRVFSYRWCSEDGTMAGSDCVVCLSGLRDGEQVRKLACRHVFHKDCFEGWLDHLNFNCPLCRSPLVSEERVTITERRVTEDLVTWFSLR